jgi:hypothetical protein
MAPRWPADWSPELLLDRAKWWAEVVIPEKKG